MVRFSIAKDGTLHVTEQAVVDAQVNQTIERSYWNDAQQHVAVTRVRRPDGSDVPFTKVGPPTIQWHGESETNTFIIESTVTGAVIPAWSIPRARILSSADSEIIRDPRDRFREILPIWRDAVRNLRSRWLLDYQYEMPPPSEQGTDIQLQLYWPDGWSPVHPITGDTIAQKIPFDHFNSTRWRVMHLFDANAPIDVRDRMKQMGAIAAFPIACLLLWLLFVVREAWRRGIRSGGVEDVDDTVLRETVFNEPPEIIATRWSGRPDQPRIEPFLRRLEKQRKLAITIEKIDDENSKVTLRLVGSREQLSPYERAGIDALMPNGFEVTSEEIQKREDFDPNDALINYLTKFAREINGPASSPWWSQLTSFAIFCYGFSFVIRAAIANQPQVPVMLIAAFLGSWLINAIWPDNFTRVMVRNTIWTVLILLIPIVIASAALLAINIASPVPPSPTATIGVALMFLAVAKANIAASATRDPRASLQRRAQLVRARRWFQNELRSEHPRIREDQRPWVEALGLRMKGTRAPEQEESWGEALVA